MDQIEFPAADALRVVRTLDAPAATVWRWLTEPPLRLRWFAGGGPFRAGEEGELIFDHDALSADPAPYPLRYLQWQGMRARERILALEAPRLLAMSWEQGREGVVSFKLGDDGARTRLTLDHVGLSGEAVRADLGAGWLAHLAVLQGRINGQPVRDFWAEHERAIAEVARVGARR